MRTRVRWRSVMFRAGETACFIGLFMVSAVCVSQSSQNAVKRLDGSTTTEAEIDSTVTRLIKAAEVAGAGIAILNDGKISYLKAYGFRDKEKNLPLTVDSVMSAASFTKVAFAYLVMELV